MSGSTLVDKVSDGQQLTDGSGSDIEIVTNMPIQQLMRKDLQPEKCERKK